MSAILSYIIGILHDNLVRVLILFIFMGLLFTFFITGLDRVFVVMSLWILHNSLHNLLPYETFEYISQIMTYALTFSFLYFVVGHHHAPHNNGKTMPQK